MFIYIKRKDCGNTVKSMTNPQWDMPLHTDTKRTVQEILWRVWYIIHIHSDLKGLERRSNAVSGSKPLPSQPFSTENDWLVLSFLEKAVVDDNVGRNVCLREGKRGTTQEAGRHKKDDMN